MKNLYKDFCTEEFDENGTLIRFDVKCPDNFNFAYDVVDKIADVEPNRRAMVWTNDEGDERIFSFSDMSRASNRVANMLTARGVKKGDKVIIILKRHFEFWFAILALHKIGAVAIPATNLLTKKDIIYRTKAASVKTVICSGACDITSFVDEAEKTVGNYDCKFIVKKQRDGWMNFNEEMMKYDDTFTRVETKSTDNMLAYFTSGTTGNPKMVMHDYSYPLAHIITAVHWHCVKDDGLHLTLAETGWGKAVWGKLYGQWLRAAGIFVYDFDKFAPADLLQLIEKYKISTFCAPPTVFRFLIKEGMKAENLASLTHASTAGEALNDEVFKRFKDVTGLSLMEGFGQTETTLLLATLEGMKPKPGSMGKPSPLYNIDLIDDNLNPVDDGVVGEIVVRPREDGTSYGLLKSYYRDEAKTASVWEGGVYHTGDTAYRDEDGYYWYVGRTDDVIKASGYRIGPFEVESVLMEHPAVLECAVTGAPDPVRGQVVRATIVLTSQYKPSEELKKDIQNFVKRTTAPYKYPRIIDFVENLPKTISGKIKRNEIRQGDK